MLCKKLIEDISRNIYQTWYIIIPVKPQTQYL